MYQELSKTHLFLSAHQRPFEAMDQLESKPIWDLEGDVGLTAHDEEIKEINEKIKVRYNSSGSSGNGNNISSNGKSSSNNNCNRSNNISSNKNSSNNNCSISYRSNNCSSRSKK